MTNAMMCNIPDSTFGSGLRSVKNTSGTIRYGSQGVRFYDLTNNLAYGWLEGADNSNYGIIFGTGNTTESLDDYAPESKVAHSSAFAYDANIRLSTTYSSLSKTYNTVISRIANNISSGTLDIKELCFIMNCGAVSGNQNLMFARKVIDTISVANGESIQGILDITSMELPA